MIGPVVVLPRSVLLEQARGMEIADRPPRNDPEIPHIYDVLLSQWSQDCTVFHNVFCCMWGGLAEVAGIVSGVASVFVVQELWVVSTVEVCKVSTIGPGELLVCAMDGWGFTASDTVWA